MAHVHTCPKLAPRIFLGLGIAILLACFLVPAAAYAAAPPTNAFVRVVHASPSAGPVDVFVDGNKVITDFRFASVNNYAPLAAGSHKVQVAPTGKGAQAAVITQNVMVNAGSYYTVAALGTQANRYSLGIFDDNNTKAAGMAKVRMYHLSPDAGPANITSGGKTVVSNLTYPNASNYLTVKPGTQTFDVMAGGATMPVSATLAANTVDSVFAVGLLKGTPKLQFVQSSANGV